MDGRWSQPEYAGNMLRGAVALVFRQQVTGIDFVQLHHKMVTEHLGYNRSTGDGEAESIAINYSFLRQWHFWQTKIINEKILGWWGEPVYGLLHS